MGPMLAPWTLLSGMIHSTEYLYCAKACSGEVTRPATCRFLCFLWVRCSHWQRSPVSVLHIYARYVSSADVIYRMEIIAEPNDSHIMENHIICIIRYQERKSKFINKSISTPMLSKTWSDMLSITLQRSTCYPNKNSKPKTKKLIHLTILSDTLGFI